MLTDIRIGFFSVRRFQQAQNHKNPIISCGEIDRQSNI